MIRTKSIVSVLMVSLTVFGAISSHAQQTVLKPGGEQNRSNFEYAPEGQPSRQYIEPMNGELDFLELETLKQRVLNLEDQLETKSRRISQLEARLDALTKQVEQITNR